MQARSVVSTKPTAAVFLAITFIIDFNMHINKDLCIYLVCVFACVFVESIGGYQVS